MARDEELIALLVLKMLGSTIGRVLTYYDDQFGDLWVGPPCFTQELGRAARRLGGTRPSGLVTFRATTAATKCHVASIDS